MQAQSAVSVEVASETEETTGGTLVVVVMEVGWVEETRALDAPR